MIKLKHTVLRNPNFVSGVQALSKITQIKSSKVLLNVVKLVKAIGDAEKDFREAFKKIATDLEIEVGTVPPVDKKEEFEKRVNDLMEIELEIKCEKINIRDLPHESLSAATIVALEDIIAIP